MWIQVFWFGEIVWGWQSPDDLICIHTNDPCPGPDFVLVQIDGSDWGGPFRWLKKAG